MCALRQTATARGHVIQRQEITKMNGSFKNTEKNKKALLSQGNRAMPQLFFSV